MLIQECRYARREHIGYRVFFDQSQSYNQERSLAALKRKAVLRLQLRCKIVKPCNRSLNQLGKKGNKQKVAKKAPLGLYFTVITVQKVGHRLKGIERNAQRQQPSAIGHTPVLDQRQDPEIDEQNCPKHAASASLDPTFLCLLLLSSCAGRRKRLYALPSGTFHLMKAPATQPAGYCRQHQIDQVLGPREKVKGNTRRQKAPPLPPARQYRIIQNQYNCQKERKAPARNAHISLRFK